jgi:hypothetical protein
MEPSRCQPLLVEIVADAGDTDDWPAIANAQDIAAFEAYVTSPEFVARSENEKARLARMRATRSKSSGD